MSHDPLVFVTTDPGRWGAGAGGPQVAAVHDNNIWNLDERLTAAEGAIPAAGRTIIGFTVSGDQFTVDFSDLSSAGPYPLPVASFSWRGDWAPLTSYAKNDLVTVGQRLILVLRNHTSAASFDIGANGGPGLDYYQLILTITRVPPVKTATVATDGTWQPVAGDEQAWWVFESAAIVILSAGVFASGDELHLDAQSGVTVTVDESTAITIRREDAMSTALKPGATATLKCIDGDTNIWKLVGALVPA